MKFILLVSALIQISFVEPRYVLVPPCQCRVNYISPIVQVHRVEPGPNPAILRPHERCSHEYRSNAIHTQDITSRTLFAEPYPLHGPEFHDEKISYQRNYYPDHSEEDLEIDTLLYEDGDHEVRHRRSVIYTDKHHEEGYIRKSYIEDWRDEEGKTVEDEEELTEELNDGIESSDEGEVFSEEGDLSLGNIVSEVDGKSSEKEKYKEVANEQEQNTEVMGQGSDEIDSKDCEKYTNKTKTKRSINDQQFRNQYRQPNQGYCSVLDRYSRRDNSLVPNVHTDDCTISKNLFFGCDKELEDENIKEKQRKARKVPKTLTQKINELKAKNDKLKNKAKRSKSKAGSESNKVSKLENKLKKDNRLRSKGKNREERLERELEVEKGSCDCGLFDRNGACSCQMQNYYNPVHTPIAFENPMAYPVQRVYRQYAPPMPFHVYHRH